MARAIKKGSRARAKKQGDETAASRGASSGVATPKEGAGAATATGTGRKKGQAVPKPRKKGVAAVTAKSGKKRRKIEAGEMDVDDGAHPVCSLARINVVQFSCATTNFFC